ncbi:TPA: hypothetical protein EYP26_02670 [Candidatus Bathyarchaeota archaeon]|nr:hypothetical protein [Candidatus Bathyarchaeota archaeon]
MEPDLKNLGKVKISAEPFKEKTDYYIEVEKPVLMAGFIEKKSLETDLSEKERGLFGTRQPVITSIDSRRVVLRVPSSDPGVCRRYVAYFLKLLDSTY